MQIRNLSSIRISAPLWRAMAGAMGVSGVLPAAVGNFPFIYGKRKTLSVTIRPERHKVIDKVVTVGYYTIGRMSFFPCRSCSAGFLTHEFAHELVHGWLDQYHQEISPHPNSEKLAEEFADAAFIALGGYIKPKRACGSFRLTMKAAERGIPNFEELASTLVRRPTKKIWSWRPPRKYTPEKS